MQNKYIPNTDEQIKEMLKVIGVDTLDGLFADIPKDLKLKRELNLPCALSEYELKKVMQDLAGKNISANDAVCFMGAGVYDHYIPAAVDHIISRSEFYTAYTPYQPEISQGTLQSIFEYQTYISGLTNMPVVNASMYDGATAVAEAALLAAAGDKKKNNIVISRAVNPEYRKVLKTYCTAKGIDVTEVLCTDGDTNVDALREAINPDTAGVIVQSPNFFGIIEDMEALAEAAHANKSLFVAVVDPISLCMLKTPGEYGADIAVGDGQALGSPMSFGGPHFGFFAASEKLMRKIPGRIVGQTKDAKGNTGYVLTLQTREQHIRREKATSNICSNQALCALAGSVYLSVMGRAGLTDVVNNTYSNALCTFEKLTATSSFRSAFSKPFYREFVVKAVKKNVNDINNRLLDYGIIGGYSLKNEYPELGNAWLVAATEKRSLDEIELFVKEASRQI